jgi:hypothetical protein
MAVHPGAKSGGPERVEFLLPESAARDVKLGFPAALRAKSAGTKPEEPANRVGISRRADLDALAAQGLVPAWTEAAGGFVARFTVRSEGALRLRVAVVVPSSDDGMEIRFAPAGDANAQVLTAHWIRETHGANPTGVDALDTGRHAGRGSSSCPAPGVRRATRASSTTSRIFSPIPSCPPPRAGRPSCSSATSTTRARRTPTS